MLTESIRNAPGFEHFHWNEDWLAQRSETILEPDLPIIDPHHHLWDRRQLYLPDELLADTDGGHNVRATVYLQCRSMYREDATPQLAPVGETEFVNGLAAMCASGAYGRGRACAGIVGFADLTLGAAVREVLDHHLAAAPDRFRGIRHSSTWHEDTALLFSPVRPRHNLLLDSRFREGFAQLTPLGSRSTRGNTSPSSTSWSTSRASPETTIVLDHLGGILGIGPYAGKSDKTFATWREALEKAASCPNVCLKLGGLGMHTLGLGFEREALPPTSETLARVWAPYVETGFELFGAPRCMFESNFPVDKTSCSYNALWNAFKRNAAQFSPDEKTALFSGTAARIYRLPAPS